ncbi:MAG TPA: iron ABC transporter permease [candidate division Zixibacteria bacterium]|nr:iron ABC transporter permease [candidate division Zixibacteria bacterium]
MPLLVTTAALLVAYFALTPLFILAYGSLSDAPPGVAGTLSFGNYVRAYSDPEFLPLVRNTLEFATASSFVSFALGSYLAWICERTNAPARSFITAAVLVLFIVPGVLETVAWILLLSPRIGLVNLVVRQLAGSDAFSLNIYSFTGMVWAESMNLYPLVFLLMSAALRSQDGAMEEASLACGASNFATLTRITLRLVTPAMVSAFLITFVRAVEAFEVPALIGARAGVFVLTTKIYGALQRLRPQYGVAGAYAMILLAISSAGVFCYYRLTKMAERYATITGKGYRPRRVDLGAWKYPNACLALAVVGLTAVLPVVNLVWSSLTPYLSVPSLEMLPHLSLKSYSELAGLPFARRAFLNSALLSFLSASSVMLLTSVVAWVTVKSRMRARFLLDNLAFLPIAIPGLVLGVSLLVLYLTLPVPVYGTLWILFIAYVTKYLPYGIRAASASMIQIGRELEEASTASGAVWRQTFVRIVLPLLMPGFVAGWIYIAVVSLRELSTSILLYTQESMVLSVLVFDLWESGLYSNVAALGVLMVLFLVAIAWIARRIGARVGSVD